MYCKLVHYKHGKYFFLEVFGTRDKTVLPPSDTVIQINHVFKFLSSLLPNGEEKKQYSTTKVLYFQALVIDKEVKSCIFIVQKILKHNSANKFNLKKFKSNKGLFSMGTECDISCTTYVFIHSFIKRLISFDKIN